MAVFETLLALASILIVVFISFLSLRKMNRFEELIPELDSFVTFNEDGSVNMDPRIVAVIDGIGSRMFQSAKMSMLGGLSGDARLEKGLKSAITQDIIEEKFPLLDAGAGLLNEFTGFNVKKYITKNPEALMQLIGMAQKNGINLAGLMGNNGAGSNPANQSSRGRM